MVFSSMTFLCAFFPLCAILYYLCKNRIYRNAVLLVFSVLFYAWGERKYIYLILGVTLAAYLGGLLIEKWRGKKRGKAAFIITTAVLVLCLAVFKYLNFIVDTVNVVPGINFTVKQIALPIGISFFIFQTLSYVFDLYLGKIGLQKNPLMLLLYVCFFPQLIAGPIVRYETVEYELKNRCESVDEMAHGIRRFVMGLAKKVIIADNVAVVFTKIYESGATGAQGYGTLAYWIAALSYTLHIYFDFSGYSDMAIGIGEFFGFHFLENFNYPYISKSITEFWRRWHMSLSTWFRDYIYIPLGGNRVSQIKRIRNILVVWALTGVWHGASWNFVVWGLYFAALLLLEKYVFGKLLEKFPKFVQWLYAFFFINIGWVIFNFTSFSDMLFALKKLFVWQSTDFVKVISENSAVIVSSVYIIIGFVLSFPISKFIDKKLNLPVAVKNILTLVLLALCYIFTLSTTFRPFIYFRF